MEVTYELTPEDVWQYSAYYRQKSLALRPAFLYSLIGVIGFVLVAGVALQIQEWVQLHQVHWFLPLMLVGVALIVIPRLPPSRKRITKVVAQQPSYFCEHQVRISPESFTERTFVGSNEIIWAAFHSVEDNPSHIFLFRAKNSAYIISKRAFTRPGEAQAFLDAARRYFDASKTGTLITAENADVWPPAPRPGA